MAGSRLTLPESLIRRGSVALMAAIPASFLARPGLAAAERPASWGQPLTLAGVANLYGISATLYRAAQPTAEGFRNLASLSVRSVISLRQTVSDTEPAAGMDLTLYRIPMKSRHVAEQDAAKVVEAMRDLRAATAKGPVLVHCHHGADRTGLIVALWRIFYQGWTKAEATRELVEGGYGFHTIWSNIPRYIDRVDLADLKARIEA